MFDHEVAVLADSICCSSGDKVTAGAVPTGPAGAPQAGTGAGCAAGEVAKKS
jgi:hypothetical protein